MKKKVGRAGLEHQDKTSGNTTLLENGGAKCGALVARDELLDPDLLAVINTWPALDEATKGEILALVREEENHV